MTEDEAKLRWCPMARVRQGDASTNRLAIVGQPASGSLCLGSACMMWRWHQVKNEAFKPVSPMMSVTPVHPADQPKPWKDSDTEGYCGLAQSTGAP